MPEANFHQRTGEQSPERLRWLLLDHMMRRSPEKFAPLYDASRACFPWPCTGVDIVAVRRRSGIPVAALESIPPFYERAFRTALSERGLPSAVAGHVLRCAKAVGLGACGWAHLYLLVLAWEGAAERQLARGREGWLSEVAQTLAAMEEVKVQGGLREQLKQVPAIRDAQPLTLSVQVRPWQPLLESWTDFLKRAEDAVQAQMLEQLQPHRALREASWSHMGWQSWQNRRAGSLEQQLDWLAERLLTGTSYAELGAGSGAPRDPQAVHQRLVPLAAYLGVALASTS